MISDKSPESIISPCFFIDIVAFTASAHAHPWFARPAIHREPPAGAAGNGPVSCSLPTSKATLEPSFVKKIPARFRAAEGDFTIPGPKFLRAGNRIGASAERLTMRHDGNGGSSRRTLRTCMALRGIAPERSQRSEDRMGWLRACVG